MLAAIKEGSFDSHQSMDSLVPSNSSPTASCVLTASNPKPYGSCYNPVYPATDSTGLGNYVPSFSCVSDAPAGQLYSSGSRPSYSRTAENCGSEFFQTDGAEAGIAAQHMASDHVVAPRSKRAKHELIRSKTGDATYSAPEKRRSLPSSFSHSRENENVKAVLLGGGALARVRRSSAESAFLNASCVTVEPQSVVAEPFQKPEQLVDSQDKTDRTTSLSPTRVFNIDRMIDDASNAMQEMMHTSAAIDLVMQNADEAFGEALKDEQIK